jgi:hypothetical protein
MIRIIISMLASLALVLSAAPRLAAADDTDEAENAVEETLPEPAAPAAKKPSAKRPKLKITWGKKSPDKKRLERLERRIEELEQERKDEGFFKRLFSRD